MRGSLLDYLYENSDDEIDIAFRHRPGLRVKSWTFVEVAKAAFQFARELEDRDIGRGDRVVIWSENSPEWVVAFYGILLRGAIAVPLDEQSTAEFSARVFEQTRPKLVLIGKGTAKTEGMNIPAMGLSDLRTVIAGHSSQPLLPADIHPSDTVEIIFTSGTTAIPKGVVLTHENILANLEPLEREMKKYLRWKFLVHPLKILCVLPLSHVFGQMMGIFVPSILRAEVIFQERLNPSEIIGTIKRERAMVLASVPRVLETLQHKIEADLEMGGGLENLRCSMRHERSWLGAWWKFRRVHRMFGFKFVSFVTGGATLDESTELFWRRLGYAVVQGYGMTETAALISLNNPFSARRGSLGQILTGRENVKLGDNGEILVRGKSVSPGYWGEAKTAGNEWLDTGDIGALDETGRLYFKGRKKDVIVTAAGLNIYPDDLEAALNSQPEVISCAVVTIDLGAGPEPAVALILRPGSAPPNIVARANKRLAQYQQILHWIEWPDADFPRTPTQKVRKNAVAEVLMQKLSSGERARDAEGSWLSQLLARVNRAAGSKVRDDSRLSEDLNLDSLSRVELLSAIEDRYQIDLDESVLAASTTVGEIEKMIRSEAGAAVERFSYPRWPLRFPVSWIRPVFYELVIQPITRILSWVKSRATGNLGGINGPVLFVSNHVTYVDPALIMSAMPMRFRRRLAIAMDGERLRAYLHPPVGTGIIKRIRWFFTYWLVVAFFNAFPLPRRSGFRESFSFAGEAMDRGYNILIFPEGELTKDGNIEPFKSGIGILASGLEAPIVPVVISGLYELRASGQRGYAKPGSVTIRFGQPIPFDSEKSAEQITRELESRVRDLQIPAP